MKVDLDEFKAAKAYLRSINICPLEELEIYDKGKLIEQDAAEIENWHFIGLCNGDYITEMIIAEGPSRFTQIVIKKDTE